MPADLCQVPDNRLYVDAYGEDERKDGKSRYRKWGWVVRRMHIWTDDEFGDGPVEHRVWRFRLIRPASYSEAK